MSQTSVECLMYDHFMSCDQGGRRLELPNREADMVISWSYQTWLYHKT